MKDLKTYIQEALKISGKSNVKKLDYENVNKLLGSSKRPYMILNSILNKIVVNGCEFNFHTYSRDVPYDEFANLNFMNISSSEESKIKNSTFNYEIRPIIKPTNGDFIFYVTGDKNDKSFFVFCFQTKQYQNGYDSSSAEHYVWKTNEQTLKEFVQSLPEKFQKYFSIRQ